MGFMWVVRLLLELTAYFVLAALGSFFTYLDFIGRGQTALPQQQWTFSTRGAAVLSFVVFVGLLIQRIVRDRFTIHGLEEEHPELGIECGNGPTFDQVEGRNENGVVVTNSKVLRIVNLSKTATAKSCRVRIRAAEPANPFLYPNQDRLWFGTGNETHDIEPGGPAYVVLSREEVVNRAGHAQYVSDAVLSSAASAGGIVRLTVVAWAENGRGSTVKDFTFITNKAMEFPHIEEAPSNKKKG